MRRTSHFNLYYLLTEEQIKLLTDVKLPFTSLDDVITSINISDFFIANSMFRLEHH